MKAKTKLKPKPKLKLKAKPGRKKKTIKKSLRLVKHTENPIISPQKEHSWETKATFNPSALYKEGRVHLLYRAIGDDDISVLGYVSSGDGFNVDERLPYPVYVQTGKRISEYPIVYGSGGGWNGGCEDSRLTAIGDEVHMIYTAFDGWGSLRTALTSIKLSDFLKRKWNWKKPVLISPPGQIHKNWVLFPEKINGKYAILHSVCPDILVDYFDSLDFDGQTYIESYYEGRRHKKDGWDDCVRGAGPPPIKTKKGWLLIYHAMDSRDPNKYKMGAMLLDLKNPSKILCRAKEPILEPDEWYENEGWKARVSYCCGAVVKDGQLFVYYGGADTVSCVASADLEKFLKKLENHKVPKLKKLKLKRT